MINNSIMLTNICPKLPMRNKAITRDFYINILGFQELGIAPFWYRGWTPINNDNDESKDDNDNDSAINNESAIDESKENNNEEENDEENDEIKLISKNIEQHMNIYDLKNEDDLLCMCCMDKRKNIVNIPCNHQVTCIDCYHKLSNKQCMICRQDIRYACITMV